MACRFQSVGHWATMSHGWTVSFCFFLGTGVQILGTRPLCLGRTAQRNPTRPNARLVVRRPVFLVWNFGFLFLDLGLSSLHETRFLDFGVLILTCKGGHWGIASSYFNFFLGSPSFTNPAKKKLSGWLWLSLACVWRMVGFRDCSWNLLTCDEVLKVYLECFRLFLTVL